MRSWHSVDAGPTSRTDAKKASRLDAFARSQRRTRTDVLEDAIETYLYLQQVNLSRIDAGLKAVTDGDFATEKQVQAEFARWRKKK